MTTPATAKRRFFVMTPQLVWALSRDPYDFMLWNVVKMVAWDKGECILGSRDLATLAMMSVGKVQDCRAYLLRMGLLEGELRRDPGYPQPVYHLRVPDLWQRNQQLIESELGRSLRKRLAFKAAQRQRPAPSLPALAAGERGLTPGERGLTPGERGLTPGEQGLTPGETIKIRADRLEKPEGERRAGPPDPPVGGMMRVGPPDPPEGGMMRVGPPDPPEGGMMPLSLPVAGPEVCHSDRREESLLPPSHRTGQGQIAQGSDRMLPATREFSGPFQGFLLSLRSSRNDSVRVGEGPGVGPPDPRRHGRAERGGMMSLSPPLGGPGGPPPSPPVGGPPDLQSWLMRLCRYEPEAVSSYRRKQVREAVQRLMACRAQADDLAAFERWWYGHDWRGKRGEPPEPRAILDTWGRFKYQPQMQEAGYGRGYRFARAEEFGLA